MGWAWLWAVSVAAGVPSGPGGGHPVLSSLQQGLRGAKVGQWVCYQLGGEGVDPQYWRLAAVGSEPAQGEERLWVEIELGDHPSLRAPLLQMKLLVGPRGISRLILAIGNDKPKELRPDALALIVEQRSPALFPSAAAPREVSRHRGQEGTLLTAAGALRAHPLELRSGGSVIQRLWVSQGVPLLHLARVEMPLAQRHLEVRDFGLDAVSRIRMPQAGEPEIAVVPAP